MERRVPFQVMLDREQHLRLRRVAQQRGDSIGSLVRESVARYLADVPVQDDPLFGLIGLADDREPRPYGDVATEHDAYLAGIVANEAEAECPEPAVAAPAPVHRPRRTSPKSR